MDRLKIFRSYVELMFCVFDPTFSHQPLEHQESCKKTDQREDNNILKIKKLLLDQSVIILKERETVLANHTSKESVQMHENNQKNDR